MVFKPAVAFVLVATLSGCAYDTYGNHSRTNNGRASRPDRAAFDSGYRDGARQGRAALSAAGRSLAGQVWRRYCAASFRRLTPPPSACITLFSSFTDA